MKNLGRAQREDEPYRRKASRNSDRYHKERYERYDDHPGRYRRAKHRVPDELREAHPGEVASRAADERRYHGLCDYEGRHLKQGRSDSLYQAYFGAALNHARSDEVRYRERRAGHGERR